MSEADAQAAVGDDFAQRCRDWEGGIGRVLGEGEGDVEVSLHQLEVRGEVTQEGVDGGGGQVAEAEDLGDLAG